MSDQNPFKKEEASVAPTDAKEMAEVSNQEQEATEKEEVNEVRDVVQEKKDTEPKKSPVVSSNLAKDHVHLHFKAQIDFQDVTDLFTMVRSGTLMENRVHALDKAFWLGGSINAYFDNHPQPEVFNTVSVPNEFEGEDGLEARIGSRLDDGPSKLDPTWAALIRKLVMIVLEQLLAS